MNALVEELRALAEKEHWLIKDIASRLKIKVKTVQPWFAKGKSHSDPSPANLNIIKLFLHPDNQLELTTVSLPDPKANSTTSKNTSSAINHTPPVSYPIARGKTIREPVQMDVELTPLETRIIDTASFQRLHHIKQLGVANLVFPGATHTRFEHCLGTLAASQTMIDAVNRNLGSPIPSEVQELIRLCALLHDITHIPYGHSLEDEGFLYRKHDYTTKGQDTPPWKNTRWELFLGPSSEIGSILGKELSEKVLTYLTAKGDKIDTLQYPYVVDIVGNTVCADLIDYLARDTYYAGLKESFDPRFLRNLTIASYIPTTDTEKPYHNRLVLSLLKQNRLRRDVVSEVMHLLRLRYSLAEKVYFNHAKIIASAMVIEAVQAALLAKPVKFSEDALCAMHFGDDELLISLRDSKVPIAEKLIGKLSSRSLYKPIYMLTYNKPSPEDTNWDKKVEIIGRFRENHRERFAMERSLESWNLLPEGSVIIYCPTEEMNLKQVEALCLWRDGKVIPLTQIPGEKSLSDAKSINDAHAELWKLYVLVERNLKGGQELMQHLASDCYHRFGLPNCMEEYGVEKSPPLERFIEQWALNHPTLAVTITEKKQLVSIKSINVERSALTPPSDSDLEKDLNDIRRTVKTVD
jgi:HD superfamily phosphohydrolase